MEQKRLPAFAERFYQLRSERNMSQEEFADFLEITRPTVGFYENGKRIPDALKLRQISEKCLVSADWLLGLTDVKTTDSEIKAICSKTGLSENAINRIVDTKNSALNKDGYFYGFIDDLLFHSGSSFIMLIYNLFYFKNALEAKYIRYKLLNNILLEELGGDENVDDVTYSEAMQRASLRVDKELDELTINTKYRKDIRQLIAAQNFIESKLEVGTPIDTVLNGAETFDISDMYKNRVIQWMMSTLEEYETAYDADKPD